MKCIQCNETTVNPKFCSQSCAAKYNNIGVARNGSPRPPCLNCGSKFQTKSAKKFCSNKCQGEWHKGQTELRILAEDASVSCDTLRKYLLSQNTQCISCGITTEYNGKPINLQMDHIDGDRSNNILSNVRLLCPNCHSQTETFAAKNISNPKGKEYRKLRYAKLYKEIGLPERT